VSIGAVGGYIEITPLHEGEDVLDDTSSATVENVSLNLGTIIINQTLGRNLNITVEEMITESVPSKFIAFGGIYGATDASKSFGNIPTTFDTITTNNVKLNFNSLNKGVSNDTNIGGITGWTKNGYFENISSNTEIKVENTSTINDANIGGVFGLADHTGTADNLLYNSKIVPSGTSGQNITNSNVGGIAGNINECNDFTHIFVGNATDFFTTNYSSRDLNVAPVAGKVTNTTLQYVAVDGTVDIILNSTSIYDTVGGIVGMYYATNSSSDKKIDQAVTNANLYLYAETNSDSSVDCVGGIAARVLNSARTTISNSYTTSSIYVRDNGSPNAFVSGIVGYKTENGVLTLDSVYSIANFVTDALNYNVTNRKDLIVMPKTGLADKIIITNVYAAFDINPNITNRWDYPYHSSYHTSKTIAEMMDSSFIGNFDSEIWKASTLGSLKSFPLLKWVNDVASGEFGYAVANATQLSGTKQNPKYNQTIGETSSVYVDNGNAIFATNVLNDSYVFIGSSAGKIQNGESLTIEKTSIVMELSLPNTSDSYNNRVINANNGKLININATSTNASGYSNGGGLVNSNGGLISNSRLVNTSTGLAIGSNQNGNIGGVIFASTLQSNSDIIVTARNDIDSIIDRCKFVTTNGTMAGASSFSLIDGGPVRGWKKSYNSYIQASDGCVYIKNPSTIKGYTTADIKNLRFGNPIDIDYTQFTLDPSNPDSIKLVLTWELKEHWYDRVYVQNGSSYYEDNTSIKAQYRWNAVTPGSFDITNGSSHPVNTSEELAQFALAYNNSSHPSVTLIIKKDIDLKGKLWTPIYNFNGTIEGGGNTISNLTVYIVNGNAGFINGLNGTINELKFEWATVMNGCTFGDTCAGIVCSYGNGFKLNKVAVVNCAACSTRSTSTAMCSWSTGTCTITDCYAIMPYKGVGSTLFARKGSDKLKITNCYGVFTADRNHNSVTLTSNGSNNFIQNHANGDEFSYVYHDGNIGTITYSATNATTVKSLSELQTEEWAGFAWGSTWVRNSSTDGTDPYSNLPQLVCHMETWQEYARANRATIKPVADSHFNSSTGTITISGNGGTVSAAAELAYVAWQLGLDEDGGIHDVSTLTINIAEDCNLSGRLWVPITFSGYASVTFNTTNNNTIDNMLALGTTDTAFIKSSGSATQQLYVTNITFHNAKVYTTPDSSGTSVGNAAIVLAKSNVNSYNGKVDINH
ncbi:MAG: hypothetical protein IK070_01945, partial [Clostridia bacterium]|nr:hypothetical protein [Clostridia bacterium]